MIRRSRSVSQSWFTAQKMAVVTAGGVLAGNANPSGRAASASVAQSERVLVSCSTRCNASSVYFAYASGKTETWTARAAWVRPGARRLRTVDEDQVQTVTRPSEADRERPTTTTRDDVCPGDKAWSARWPGRPGFPCL